MSIRAWKYFLISLVLSFTIGNWIVLSRNTQGFVNIDSAFLPLIFVLSVTCFSRALFTYPPFWLKLILSLMTSVLSVRYLHWRITETLVLDWYSAPISLAVLLMELIAILNSTLVNYQTLIQTNHSSEADRRSQQVKMGVYKPSVDVFVPTYNEPIDVLRRTLVGCQAMQYSGQTIVFVLDDGKRSEVAELARELGCEYLTRSDSAHAKAGNLNHGLKVAQGEIIVVFDADFIPLTHFLERSIGFFEDPSVGMVITPQNFYNPDPPEINLGGRVLPHEQTVFYHIIQAGRDTANSAICTGTSTAIRRAYLNEIGGFPTDTIVEDWVTGYRLQAKGYRTIYLNEMLSIGAAPDSLAAYLLQRIRWAEGTLKTFLNHQSPVGLAGLNLIQKINHLSGAIYWIDQATQSLGYVSPALFILFGMRSMETTIPEVISYWLPNYVSGLVLVSWIIGSRTILVSYVYNGLQCFHLLPVVINTFLRPHAKVKFHVTPKGITHGETSIDLHLMGTVIVLLIVNFLLFCFGTIYPNSLHTYREFYAINILWTGWNSIILGLTTLAGIDVIEERRSVRIDCSEFCEAIVADQQESYFKTHLVNISEGGVAFLHPKSVLLKVGQLLKFSIVSEPIELTAEILQVGEIVNCRFLDATGERRRQLIEFIFCRPRHWKRPEVADELRAIRALILSLFDLYPLRRTRN